MVKVVYELKPPSLISYSTYMYAPIGIMNMINGLIYYRATFDTLSDKDVKK